MEKEKHFVASVLLLWSFVFNLFLNSEYEYVLDIFVLLFRNWTSSIFILLTAHCSLYCTVYCLFYTLYTIDDIQLHTHTWNAESASTNDEKKFFAVLFLLLLLFSENEMGREVEHKHENATATIHTYMDRIICQEFSKLFFLPFPFLPMTKK